MGSPHVYLGDESILGSVFTFTTLLIAIPSAVLGTTLPHFGKVIYS
jgi:hypothetical protein